MIGEFNGEYSFLSNFYECDVEFEGKLYPSAEHAFQAAKSTDPAVRAKIASKPTPGQAKRSGRRVELRPDWDYIKDAVMEEVVRDKFKRNENLRFRLLETGDQELIEGNRWNDQYWGVDINKNRGQNRLGKILMKIRKELRPSSYPS